MSAPTFPPSKLTLSQARALLQQLEVLATGMQVDGVDMLPAAVEQLPNGLIVQWTAVALRGGRWWCSRWGEKCLVWDQPCAMASLRQRLLMHSASDTVPPGEVLDDGWPQGLVGQ